MKVFIERHGFGLLIVTTIAVIVAIACFGINYGNQLRQEHQEEIRSQGGAAYLSGVPAEANPYRGYNKSYPQWWLEGWIRTKESLQPKEIFAPIK